MAALPEEKIRQALIKDMIERLGYPQGSLVLEKSLAHLPHLHATPSLPKRRTDLVILAKNLHPLHSYYPLLLVECKAIPLTDKVLRQMIGYNQYVKAHFIAAVNQTTAFTGWYDAEYQDFKFKETLFTYDFLMTKANERLAKR